MCKHHNFYADVKVGRICETEEEEKDPEADIKIFMGDVKIKCVDCGVEMQFLGIENGLNFNYPTTNIDATEVHLPMRSSSKPRVINKNVN